MLRHHQLQIPTRSYPMTSMKETGRGIFFVMLESIDCVDWRENLSFLGEVQSAATLTDKQVRLSHLPIVSIIPIVSELQKTT